ncbi:MAG: diguanylate cyclase [Pseudomonadota bacterium]
MHMGLSVEEGAALRGLLEKAAGDIVIRLDTQGFVTSASENFAELGYELEGLLLKPHITDLTERDEANDLSRHFANVLEREPAPDWIEFPLKANMEAAKTDGATPACWYALSLRRIEDNTGALVGAVGLLRSVERMRTLEGELYSRALVDPLTGLANRHAFCANLRRRLVSGTGGFMVLFEVDRMRPIFLQYGQRTADEIVWGFAKFLEAMVLPEYELAQFDGERFCVILPEMTREAARDWSVDVLQTFHSLALTTTSRSPQLSASAGLAPIECTVDWTLRQAELGLVMARARGGKQVNEVRQTAQMTTAQPIE